MSEPAARSRWTRVAEFSEASNFVRVICIRTSGWSYPHWGRGVFYPRGMAQGDWLAHYARHFPAVEINSSFYRLPSGRTVETWRDSTPCDFRFTAKASRFLTHMKKLSGADKALERFLGRMSILGAKLAVVLFQLPPFWNFDERRLAEFAESLARQKILSGIRTAIEFRNASWLVPRAMTILREHGIALVHSDPAGLEIPRIATAEFLYLRRHGWKGEDYPLKALETDAHWIRLLTGEGRDVFCFFNNDAGGAAVRDAVCLRRLISAQPTIRRRRVPLCRTTGRSEA